MKNVIFAFILVPFSYCTTVTKQELTTVDDFLTYAKNFEPVSIELDRGIQIDIPTTLDTKEDSAIFEKATKIILLKLYLNHGKKYSQG